MAEFSEIQQVSTMAADNTFIITVGAKSRQISFTDMEALLSTSGTFANVIDSLASDYTLVVQSTYPETQVLMNATNGASGEITIPVGAFTIGSRFVVSNASTDTDLGIVAASGVTVANVTSESFVEQVLSADLGNNSATFVNVALNSWVAYGDIGGAS